MLLRCLVRRRPLALFLFAGYSGIAVIATTSILGRETRRLCFSTCADRCETATRAGIQSLYQCCSSILKLFRVEHLPHYLFAYIESLYSEALVNWAVPPGAASYALSPLENRPQARAGCIADASIVRLATVIRDQRPSLEDQRPTIAGLRTGQINKLPEIDSRFGYRHRLLSTTSVPCRR